MNLDCPHANYDLELKMYDICLHEAVVQRNYQYLAASGRQ